MAEGTTPPQGSTRFVETTRGILSFQQLAPLLAERALQIQVDIEEGRFGSRPLDEAFLQDLHRQLCGDLLPDLAGRWRTVAVRVSDHEPPPAHQVPGMMRDYALDLAARGVGAPPADDSLFIEALAFAEGRLLSVHPFQDFNGRVPRLWLAEILRRADWPLPDLVPDDEQGKQVYLRALAAADGRDYRPLIEIWRQRLGGASLEA